MFEAEDLLVKGEAGRLRDRPQLGNASGVGWHPESSASLCESQDSQHRLSPNIVTLDLPSHLLPRQETGARPKAGPRSISPRQGKSFEMCPEFLSPCTSLLTLFLPQSPSSQTLGQAQLFKQGAESSIYQSRRAVDSLMSHLEH